MAAELIYQRCRWCGTASFRRLLCPACASSDLDSHRSDGRGVVVRTNVLSRYRRTMRSESVVRFPEGFTLRCRVIGVPPHLVREGTPVRPATGSDQDAVGDLVVEVCGVRDTDERERWRGRQ